MTVLSASIKSVMVYVFILQAVDKRPAVPVPVNAATAGKLITSSSQAAGKLGFHGGSSGPAVQAPTAGILPAKKPPISRGVPPPVPPNKPVVPPKKEAAYLRRPELSQSTQDTVKFGKQVLASHAMATSGAAPMQAQQPLPASGGNQASDEEVSNMTEPR